MKKVNISYERTNFFSKVVLDYLNEAKELKSFYNLPPALSSFPETIEKIKLRHNNRESVSETLLKQHTRLFAEKNLGAVRASIELLRDKNTFTVTTAHQPNLFLGPLYVIYKTISTIVLAKKLNENFPNYRFVPVFWLGSEDHDKNELNHIQLFGKTFTWNTAQQGAFGRMSTSSLRPWVNEIKLKLGESDAAKELAEALDDCYVKERNIGAATRKFLYHFFAEDGLVVVDGDDRELKKHFAPIVEKEITEGFSFKTVSESNERFSIHYDTQISPREINLFYLNDEVRERIVKEEDGYKVLNTSLSFSKEEMISLIHSAPEKFSPNVILRPVYQETILPDVAVIGGGAEVTYWLQLKSLFDELQQPFPLVFLRNSALWIDAVSAARIEKIHITEEQLFNDADAIVNQYVESQTGESISLEDEMQRITAAFNDAIERALKIEPTLKGAFESEKVRVIKMLEGFEDRLLKAAKRKDETSVQQIKNLKEKLFPSNSLQERHDNFMSIYSRLGKNFIEELKLHLDPLEKSFVVLSEEVS
ncbi:MAG: bacillithiol biosynthesis cysteine-adding enzyme BshC [Chitinophagales bacterium]|nr:bacillithiol biosynthesis cysteine-adding enzyme BshC [Chitinophagales bacterium]